MLYRMNVKTWSVERVSFLMGGIFSLLFGILTLFVDEKFIFGNLLVGTMLVIFAMTGYCPMAILAAKIRDRTIKCV